jgi:hypothetical protein
VRGPLRWTQNSRRVCIASFHPQRSESRRGPLTLVRGACHRAGHFGPDPLAHSTSPRTRVEVKQALSFSQRDPRRSFVHGEARIGKSASLSTTRHLLFSSLKKERGGGTPANAGYHRRILRCGARSFGARTPDGVPPRLSPKGIIPSQRLSFGPGFLGRGLHGRYPPSPVPVQGCTSHPGRNAGRHDAQAARERTANPPAGTAPAPPHGLPPEGVPW